MTTTMTASEAPVQPEGIDTKQELQELIAILDWGLSDADMIRLESYLVRLASKIQRETADKYKKEMTDIHRELDQKTYSLYNDETEEAYHAVNIEDINAAFAQRGINAFPIDLPTSPTTGE